MMGKRIVVALACIMLCAVTALVGCSGSSQASSAVEKNDQASQDVSSDSPSSSSAVVSTSSASASSGSESKALTVSDIKVTNVKLESAKGDPHGRDCSYYLTGTLENASSQEARLVEVEITGKMHSKDEYGDDKVKEELLPGFCFSPGVDGQAFFNIKAGEKRNFRYFLDYGNDYEVTDPKVTVKTATAQGGLQDDVIFANEKDFDVALKQLEGKSVWAVVKNNTGKNIQEAELRFIVFNENHGYMIRTLELRHLWPGVAQEAWAPMEGGDSEPVFLDAYYRVDAEKPNTKLSDLFGIEMQSDGTCKLTNKTGHYLREANISYYGTRLADNARMELTEFQDYLKPGETYVLDMNSENFSDPSIFDIQYSIDEEKDKSDSR